MHGVGAVDLGTAIGAEDPDDWRESEGSLVVEWGWWGTGNDDSIGGDVEAGGEAGGGGSGAAGEEPRGASWWKGSGTERGQEGAGEQPGGAYTGAVEGVHRVPVNCCDHSRVCNIAGCLCWVGIRTDERLTVRLADSEVKQQHTHNAVQGVRRVKQKYIKARCEPPGDKRVSKGPAAY